MVDKKKSDIERNLAFKQFKLDVKKHIDDISYKYIIEGETSDQAMMFIPAEAIFAEINAYHSDLIEYAYKKRVWLTSPTTLISTLTMIMMIIQNMERDKYTSIIHEELNKLGIEFTRFKDRFDKLSKSIQTVNKDVESFQITTDKIKKKFDSISNVEIKDSNLPMGKSFLNEFKKDLLELFPNTYSDLEHYILNKDIFSYSHLLEDTFRLEHGYYNYKDISTVKNIPKGRYWWDSEYATWEYYYKGIEEGFYTFNDLINFLNDNMEYFEYLVPMFIEKGEEKEYEYLCNMIEEAKLQDNIRFTIFFLI
jgi:hypothetical protein